MKKSKRSTHASSSQPLKKPSNSSISTSKQYSSNTKSSKSWFNWLDENILLILCGFLFAFIPLYPKIPLADLIPGYIVRLRLEDLFVAFTVGIFLLQIARKKIQWSVPVRWIVIAYAIVGILSTISAVVITQSVPPELLHIGKTALHYFRYLEYFSLLFIAYSAIQKRRDVYLLLGILVVTVFAISLYGFGQKFYYWPVYSTMNREFSKGMRLYLTEHARVQSTFGGHYDMAGYLVIALPMILAFFYGVKKWLYKIPILLSFLSGLWLLIVGSSRSSFGAFLVGISLVIAGFAFFQPTLKQKVTWFISRSFLMGFVFTIMMMNFGDSIYERFLQTLQAYPALHNAYHGINDKKKHFYRDNITPIVQNLDRYNFLPEPEKPQNAMSTDELAQQLSDGNVLVSSDEQPTTGMPNEQRPSDVYEDIPDIIWEATVEGGVATVTARQVPRTFSTTAQTHGLSLAIRLDTLWPRALQGFYTNPLLGTGYATLTKETRYHFTEAESTDNNFLRTLGETGLLGFITFYGVIALAMFTTLKQVMKNKNDMLVQILGIGFLSGSVGLLLNAVFIDVYAASKIAFSYWAITGITLAVMHKLSRSPELSHHETKSS